jgi:hypothetical protein
MMPFAHPGVCVLAQNIFIIRLDLTFFLLCGGDAAAVLPMHPTLYVYLSVCPYLFPRLCCLSSDTDLLLFLYVPYPLALLAHDAYVNRTMTYDHTTSSRSTIYPFLASTTDIILSYLSFSSSSTMMRYLSYRTYRCRQGG